MKFDALKKAKVEIVENDYVENRVAKLEGDFVKKDEVIKESKKFGFLDSAIIATAMGGFASLGYLCFTVAKLVGGSSVIASIVAKLVTL